jgi:hypothetical protein
MSGGGANDPDKQKQWAAFVIQLDHAAPSLNEVVVILQRS